MGLLIDSYGDFSSKELGGNQKLSANGNVFTKNTKVKSLLSFERADHDMGIKLQKSNADSKIKVLTSFKSDGTEYSNWMESRYREQDDAERRTGGKGTTVEYQNGNRTVIHNGHVVEKEAVTKRDSKGRPTQIQHSSSDSYTTDITYNKDGGKTEKTKGLNMLHTYSKEYRYDKNGKLLYGREVRTVADNELNRKFQPQNVGKYSVHTYENGVWYVQFFDKNGKAVSKKRPEIEVAREGFRAEGYTVNEDPNENGISIYHSSDSRN